MDENRAVSVREGFDVVYKKIRSLDFGTPLTVDMFCCICGRFLTLCYEDSSDRKGNNKCRFCLNCWQTIKITPTANCLIHEQPMLSKETMVRKAINLNPTGVLIICPYECGNLYTVLKLCDHLSKCRNRPILSRQDPHKTGAFELGNTSAIHQQSSSEAGTVHMHPNVNFNNPSPPDDNYKHPLVSKAALPADDSAKTGSSTESLRDDFDSKSRSKHYKY